MQPVVTLIPDLGRKYTAQDVTSDYIRQAQDYLTNYTGDFVFLRSVKTNALRYGLSAQQCAGVLNCMLNDQRRHTAPSIPSNDPIPTTPLTDGTYTIVDPPNHVTLRIKQLGPDSMPAQPRDTRIISYLNGPDNTNDFQGFGFYNPKSNTIQLWKSSSKLTRQYEALSTLAAADQTSRAASGLTYALLSNNCYRCGRKLTVPASIYAGMGPICAEKGL